MKKLKGMRAYLSGAIDQVSDDGIGWRKKLKSLCEKEDISLSFLDPCDKPNNLKNEVGEEKKKVIEMKEKGEEEWNELQKVVKNIKRIDYRMVDFCDVFVLYTDPRVHACGSYFECKVAEEERKPMLFILPEDLKKNDIPSWLIDIADWDKIFVSVPDCVKYLKKLDDGEVEMDDRWIRLS